MGRPRKERQPLDDVSAPIAARSESAESTAQVGPRAEPVVQTMLVVGDAERAITFYERVFGAREVWRVMHFHRVGHAVLRIGRSEIVVLDEFPEADILGPESVTIGSAVPRLLLEIDDVDAVLERAIAAGATVLRRAEDQWWGVRSGTIHDPFGYRWSIHTVVEAFSEDEIQRRADELGLYPPPQPSDA
jgi:PhnB protein